MPSLTMTTLPSGEAARVTSYGFGAGACCPLLPSELLLLLPSGGVCCRVVSLKTRMSCPGCVLWMSQVHARRRSAIPSIVAKRRSAVRTEVAVSSASSGVGAGGGEGGTSSFPAIRSAQA